MSMRRLSEGQGLILKQLELYLIVLNLKNGRDEKREVLLKTIRDLEKDEIVGHCYAFSLVRGAMRAVGKLNWWEHALAEIANWDETFDALKNKVKLPDAKKEISLEYLFERVLNYIIFHQGNIEFISPNPIQRTINDRPLPIGNEYSLRDVTDPKQPYFEILDDSGGIKVVEQRVQLHSHSKSDLKDLLQHLKPLLESDKNIVLTLADRNHALDLAYCEGKWILSDPNYSHKKPENMSRNFAADDIKGLMDEMENCYGSAILFKNSSSFDLVFLSGYNPAKILNSIDLDYFSERVPYLVKVLNDTKLESKQVGNETQSATKEHEEAKQAWQTKKDSAKKTLFEAVKKGDLKIIKAAFEEDEKNLHVTKGDGTTLLHRAILKESPEIVSFLLKNGADLYAENDYHTTPLSLAYDKRNPDILSILKNYEKPPETFQQTSTSKIAETLNMSLTSDRQESKQALKEPVLKSTQDNEKIASERSVEKLDENADNERSKNTSPPKL